MRTSEIRLNEYLIEIGPLLNSGLEKLLTESYRSSKIAIICDENTREYCLELLLTGFSELGRAEIIEIPAGEETKNFEMCIQVWEALSEYHFSRNDLIVNLGGGMICDFGAFVASIYKRGIDYIHIPTSLLAMVDASIGGKNGIDLGKFKNQLGVFSNPKAVFIDSSFLASLPSKEKDNGFAEMLKHGLIKSSGHWEELVRLPDSGAVTESLIVDSLRIKQGVVESDPFEKNERKSLNFGHTFGHAFEGFLLGTLHEISHGHAVALGMICETFLSYRKGFLEEASYRSIRSVLDRTFEMVDFSPGDFQTIYDLMLQDKKNREGKIRCTLLKDIGEALIDIELNKEEIFYALGEIHKGK